MLIVREENKRYGVNYKWLYTYDYAPDSIWESWRNEVYGDKADNSDFIPEWIDTEAESVIRRVSQNLRIEISDASCDVSEENRNAADKKLTYILLSDSHFAYNGTWDDTAASIKAVAEKLENKGISVNGIIHLGDLSDGLLPLDKTLEIEKRCISDMESIGVPVHIVPGNHDYNYFRGNPDIKYPSTLRYYIDEPEQKLRLIFIDSFDPREEIRYGFTEECVHWIDKTLDAMPQNYVTIIFSHVPPLARNHAWSDQIRNSHFLIPVLDKHADRILAFINGHSHCDHLFNDLRNGKFPIISINCAKCEYFREHKPEGAVVPYRRLGDRTQESFDIMQVDTAKREIYFTRFGAGFDRVVKNGKGYYV